MVFIHRVITSLRKWTTSASMLSSATSVSRAHHPTLWEGSPCYSMVMKWAAQFKRGRETRLKDYPLTRSMTNNTRTHRDGYQLCSYPQRSPSVTSLVPEPPFSLLAPSLPTTDGRTVETPRVFGSQERQIGEVCRQTDGLHRQFGMSHYYSDLLRQ